MKTVCSGPRKLATPELTLRVEVRRLSVACHVKRAPMKGRASFVTDVIVRFGTREVGRATLVGRATPEYAMADYQRHPHRYGCDFSFRPDHVLTDFEAALGGDLVARGSLAGVHSEADVRAEIRSPGFMTVVGPAHELAVGLGLV